MKFSARAERRTEVMTKRGTETRLDFSHWAGNWACDLRHRRLASLPISPIKQHSISSNFSQIVCLWIAQRQNYASYTLKWVYIYIYTHFTFTLCNCILHVISYYISSLFRIAHTIVLFVVQKNKLVCLFLKSLSVFVTLMLIVWGEKAS